MNMINEPLSVAMQMLAAKAEAWPGTTLLLVAPSWAGLHAAMKAAWAAPGFAEGVDLTTRYSETGGFGKSGMVRFRNGSSIRFVSAASGLHALCGDRVDEAWVLTPTPPRVVDEVERRAGACWLVA